MTTEDEKYPIAILVGMLRGRSFNVTSWSHEGMYLRCSLVPAQIESESRRLMALLDAFGFDIRPGMILTSFDPTTGGLASLSFHLVPRV